MRFSPRADASGAALAAGTGRFWRIDTDGKVTLLDTLGPANGIEVSPDEKRIYVGASRSIWIYDLSPQGTVSNKRLLIAFPDFGTDGMRCDIDGNLYIARIGKGVIAIAVAEGMSALVANVRYRQGQRRCQSALNAQIPGVEGGSGQGGRCRIHAGLLHHDDDGPEFEAGAPRSRQLRDDLPQGIGRIVEGGSGHRDVRGAARGFVAGGAGEEVGVSAESRGALFLLETLSRRQVRPFDRLVSRQVTRLEECQRLPIGHNP